MKDADRQTRSHLMALFERHGFHPRTDLGQNFLIDLNLIDFIVDAADLNEQDVVLEVGAGTGGMTTALAREAAAVLSVELDKRVFGLAREATAGCGNVTLLNRDVLKNKNAFAPEVLEAVQRLLDAEPGRRLKLVSNLPYNVATPVVSNLVATDLPWERMVITIQKELGEKMAARPGRGNYGALSVWLQSQCHVRILRRLGPKVFWPRPQVDSVIVRIVPDPSGRARIADRPFFLDFLRRVFHHRRKVLRSVVVGMYRKQLSKPEVDAVLESCGLEPNSRAEALSPLQLVELSNRLCAATRAAAES